MDRFKIDSHKTSFHVQQVGVIENYYHNPLSHTAHSAFKELHPIYVEISPIGACNHRCNFCAVDYIGYKPRKLDTSSLKKSLTRMGENGVKSVMYAGEGEPLLHKDIAEIVNHTKLSGIDAAFTTNAVNLNECFLDQCGKDISWIKVSFNGGDSKTYSKIHGTQESDFYKVVNNLKMANEWRIRNRSNLVIGLQSVLLPDNADSMENLVLLAKEIGLDYVVVKPYSQHSFSETRVYQNLDYSPYMVAMSQLTRHNTPNFSVVIRENTIKNWAAKNDGRYCKCLATPSLWAYIMSDGSVYSCSAYLLDDRFLLGNIHVNDFSDIWVSDRRMEHYRFVTQELDISSCRVNCRMDQVNRYLDNVINKTVDHVNFI